MTALLEFIDVFNEIVANPDPASCWVKHLIMMPVYNWGTRIIKLAQLHARGANTQAC